MVSVIRLCPPGPGGHRSQQRLGIGRKGGIGSGAQGAKPPQRADPADLQPVWRPANLTPGCGEGGQNRAQVRPVRPQQLPLSPGAGYGAEVGGRHDPVRHHPVLPGVQGAAALDGDPAGARSLHPGAQAAEEVLQVHNLRLSGGVVKNGQPPGAAGGQHGIFRGPHTGDGQRDPAP